MNRINTLFYKEIPWHSQGTFLVVQSVLTWISWNKICTQNGVKSDQTVTNKLMFELGIDKGKCTADDFFHDVDNFFSQYFLTFSPPANKITLLFVKFHSSSLLMRGSFQIAWLRNNSASFGFTHVRIKFCLTDDKLVIFYVQ